jgi:signal transduction histidine kinase
MIASGPARPLRFYQVRLFERDAWFGATVAALFNALGMLIEILIIREIPGIATKPAAISASMGVIVFTALLIRRKTPSVEWAYVAYSITFVSVATALFFMNLHFAVLEKNWVPFQETKLGCLVAAMVAPGFWLGLLSILAYCLSAVLQFEFLFPPHLKARVSAEPWATLAFGLAGVLALIYRFRRAQLEQEVARIQAQNFAIKRLADVFLNIRDRMNTPLQVIELSVELLRNSDVPPKPILERIGRSVRKLREINSVLISHEKEIEWETKK